MEQNSIEAARLTIHQTTKTYGLMIGLFLLVVLFVLYGFLEMLMAPPKNFPIGVDVTIEEGLTQKEIINVLYDKQIVRSKALMQIIIYKEFDNTFILSGVYHFSTPLSMYEVGKAITSGTNRAPLIRLTLPEGFSVNNFATYLPKEYVYDEETIFTIEDEGYLFPDTYFISKDMSMVEVRELLRSTMDAKLKTLEEAMNGSSLTKHEILTLASILEREANDTNSMRIVSGILQKRLKMGMPLQVDATFDYVLGKASHELTIDDLALESPYNTYTHTGLPPTPIANPGLRAIEAVLSPLATPFLYYLTDEEGVFHYAKDFEEHKNNKVRYLR